MQLPHGLGGNRPGIDVDELEAQAAPLDPPVKVGQLDGQAGAALLVDPSGALAARDRVDGADGEG